MCVSAYSKAAVYSVNASVQQDVRVSVQSTCAHPDTLRLARSLTRMGSTQSASFSRLLFDLFTGTVPVGKAGPLYLGDQGWVSQLSPRLSFALPRVEGGERGK